MAPSHGFAAASHREAALRGTPASHRETAFRGAAGFREARRRYAIHPSRNAMVRRRAGRPRYRAARRLPCGPPIAKIRPGKNVTLQYLSHDGSPGPPPCEPPPPHLRQRQNPCRSIGGQYSRSCLCGSQGLNGHQRVSELSVPERVSPCGPGTDLATSGQMQ